MEDTAYRETKEEKWFSLSSVVFYFKHAESVCKIKSE